MREGWSLKPLGELTHQFVDPCTIEPDQTYVNLGLRMYAKGVFSREPKLGSEMKAIRLFRVRPGQFIYNRMFAAGGSFGRVPPELAGGVVSNEFPVYDVDESSLLPEFLHLYFQQPSVWREVERECTGTTKSRLRWKEELFAKRVIYLPPLDEQRRIVDLIGALDDAIEAAENQRATVDAVLDGLAEQLLFSGSERCQVPVSDLAEKRGLIGGPFGSSLVSHDYVESGVPIIRGTNMPKSGRYVWGDFAYVSEAKAESLRRNHAIPGDVIFTQRGTLGQVGLVPAEGPPQYVISQSQMRLRVNDELVTAGYIYHIFRSTRMVGRIKALNTATANPHINLGILAKIDIPLPPLDEQAAICSTLDSVQAAAGEAQQFAIALHTLRSELLTALLSGAHEIPDTYDEVMTAAV
ncbi:restriction endonuclease subunit S [Arthrobacter sp. H14]|uniref:restriction endonuclease subunit S n=1 Tax=Arthrobacter sp. H14 TaxID=1312959 RepID=UPI0004AD7D66|nr:restriction endonuclease subunit S [Arthrobacter sp. H14]